MHINWYTASGLQIKVTLCIDVRNNLAYMAKSQCFSRKIAI